MAGNIERIRINMESKGKYDEWQLMVMLMLTGCNDDVQETPRYIYESGDDAVRDMNYCLLKNCWEAGMDQYKAADFFRERRAGELGMDDGGHDISIDPVGWLKWKKERGFYGDEISSGGRKVSLGTYRFAMWISVTIGTIIGWNLHTIIGLIAKSGKIL